MNVLIRLYTLLNAPKNNSLNELKTIMDFHNNKWLSISIKYFCWTNVIYMG